MSNASFHPNWKVHPTIWGGGESSIEHELGVMKREQALFEVFVVSVAVGASLEGSGRVAGSERFAKARNVVSGI